MRRVGLAVVAAGLILMSIYVARIATDIPHPKIGNVIWAVYITETGHPMTERPDSSEGAKIIFVHEIPIDKIRHLTCVNSINGRLIEDHVLTFIHAVNVRWFLCGKNEVSRKDRTASYWKLDGVIWIFWKKSRNEFSVSDRVRDNSRRFTSIYYFKSHDYWPIRWLNTRLLIGNFNCHEAAFTLHKSPYLHTREYGQNESKDGNSVETFYNAAGSRDPFATRAFWLRGTALSLAIASGVCAVLLVSGVWDCRFRLMWAMAAYLLAPFLIIYGLSAW